MVGRRVEARVDAREVLAAALDTGENAGRHQRSFAKHHTITAIEHARTPKAQREDRRGVKDTEREVQVRSLTRYEALIV